MSHLSHDAVPTHTDAADTLPCAAPATDVRELLRWVRSHTDHAGAVLCDGRVIWVDVDTGEQVSASTWASASRLLGY